LTQPRATGGEARMTLNDSYLFDAGWLFFALWTVIVGAVSITAFRRDLFPSRTNLELAHHPTTNSAPPESQPN
jgi:hypothetical protein